MSTTPHDSVALWRPAVDQFGGSSGTAAYINTIGDAVPFRTIFDGRFPRSSERGGSSIPGSPVEFIRRYSRIFRRKNCKAFLNLPMSVTTCRPATTVNATEADVEVLALGLQALYRTLRPAGDTRRPWRGATGHMTGPGDVMAPCFAQLSVSSHARAGACRHSASLSASRQPGRVHAQMGCASRKGSATGSVQ